MFDNNELSFFLNLPNQRRLNNSACEHKPVDSFVFRFRFVRPPPFAIILIVSGLMSEINFGR